MTSGELRPAAALAIWCARGLVSPAPSGTPPVEGMEVSDWADFVRLTLAHAALPVAWKMLSPHRSLLPELVTGDLQTAFDANARRNLRLLGELRLALRDLDAAGIRAVPWKGPLLAERAYGDLALRQFYDLDILVPPAQLRAARDLLVAKGFRPEKQMTHVEEETYVEHQGELELVRETDGLWLELHTAIVPTYYARGRSSADLWERIRPTRLGRVMVWALDEVDELEALCVHGSKHRWDRLAWILDVAMMSRSLTGDQWGRLLYSARQHGSLRMVSLGLLLARDVTAADLPAPVAREAGRDRTARSLAAAATHELFDPRPSRFDGLLFHARMRERAPDRARYLLSVIYTPSGADWEALSLPRPLFPLYAVTRPVRLAWKYGRRLLSSPPGIGEGAWRSPPSAEPVGDVESDPDGQSRGRRQQDGRRRGRTEVTCRVAPRPPDSQPLPAPPGQPDPADRPLVADED